MLFHGHLFSLKVGGVPLRVVRFSGHESISGLFEFRVEVAGPETDPEMLIGQPGVFHIAAVDIPRVVHGIVCESEYIGETRTLHRYKLTIAPWVHRLLHRVGVRLFQDKTTEQIVTEVLRTAGLPRDWFRFSLVEKYAPRNYCVQYRETDFAFISRLLEEDGVFSFFEHEEDKHVWVMADHIKAHTPIVGTPVLWFSPQLGSVVPDREHVHRFRFGGRVRSGKMSLRDVNLHRPGQKMEVGEEGKVDSDLEVYDYPGEYQDPGRGGPHEGSRMAMIRLEALQSRRRSGGGESDCPRLLPGKVMFLAGHPRSELNGEYRLIEVSHMGTQPQVLDQDMSGESSYSNTFAVTELAVPFRPPRQTPRPIVRGLQTGTVVGPAGEEVHVDEHGRVRVQFHWDREGEHNEKSTCWVRVAQIWAGNGWGAMFIPRIGQEVLIDYLEGDPDKPIVVGRLYHGSNRTPYSLPGEKTKSTIKSESSLGNGGFNEFRFEDRKGHEEIFLHAQKDWNTVILHDLTESVTAHRTSSIGANETISVGVNRSTDVCGNNSTSVGATHSVTIVPPPLPEPEPDFGGPPVPAVPPTGTTMFNRFFKLTTGLATITVNGADVTIEANGSISIGAGGTLDVGAVVAMAVQSDAHLQLEGKTVTLLGTGGDVLIQGGANVEINPPTPICVAIAALADMPPDQRAAAEAAILEQMGSIDPSLAQLMHDRDLAMLSAAGYARKDGSPPLLPPGYSSASDADLNAFGLTRNDLDPDIRIFRSTQPNGEPHYVLVFRGTELGAGKATAASDIGTDLWQGVGGDSEPYRRGIRVASAMAASGADMEITGHSKGGGQAAAASAATGEKAVTFNAAGVHHRTLDRAGVSQDARDASTQNIRAYSNPKDPLNGAQDHRGTVLGGLGVLGTDVNPWIGLGIGVLAADGALPPALGTRIETPLGRNQPGGPMAGHSIDTMITTMNEMIEDHLSELCGC